MKIAINDHRKIYHIQQDFNTLFPNLKIEFYGKPNTSGGQHSDKIVDTESKTLGQCRVEHNKGEITITPHMSVNELEQHFNDAYGLAIHICKKTGNNWVEIATGNKLSLEEHNK
jgi:hypothetical protein